MDNDAVRTSGDRTLVDMWIDGKFRSVAVTRAAIEARLQLPGDGAAAMSDEDRREFVRANLKLIASAATDAVRQTNPDASSVVIDAGQLGGGEAAANTDRRQGGDRRTGRDRRKVNLGPPLPGERRRGDRRP
jgi:hypothetical protein